MMMHSGLRVLKDSQAAERYSKESVTSVEIESQTSKLSSRSEIKSGVKCKPPGPGGGDGDGCPVQFTKHSTASPLWLMSFVSKPHITCSEKQACTIFDDDGKGPSIFPLPAVYNVSR